MEQNELTPAWIDHTVNREPIPPVTEPRLFVNDIYLAAGGGGGRQEVLTKKPRKPRRRKEVTADKFIVLRVTEQLYQQVQSASELAGTDTSKWVRQAVVEQLGK